MKQLRQCAYQANRVSDDREECSNEENTELSEETCSKRLRIDARVENIIRALRLLLNNCQCQQTTMYGITTINGQKLTRNLLK